VALIGRARPTGLGPVDRVTLGLGAAALASFASVVALEVARVWRKGSAPLPSETDSVLLAAEEALTETVEVARTGYRDLPAGETALFNLLAATAISFGSARTITWGLKSRGKIGPFRDLIVGRRHIHHYVPGIVLAFGSGAAAIVTRNEELEPKLALAFGTGIGLTLDESALLLELEDVYWTREGMLSVQIGLAVVAGLASLTFALRFLRRGEQIVLEEDPGVGWAP
jgi:hypothetical protein